MEYRALTCLDSGHMPMFTEAIFNKMNEMKGKGCPVPSDC